MLTRQQQAEYLRSVLVPYIQTIGVEREFERHDGTKHRYREAHLGGFVLRYETPFHRNPRPMASCWDEALYLQINPTGDYYLAVHFQRSPDNPAQRKWVTMFDGCWHSKGNEVRISSFRSNESRWYDILVVALELSTKAAQNQVGAAEAQEAQAKLMPTMSGSANRWGPPILTANAVD